MAQAHQASTDGKRVGFSATIVAATALIVGMTAGCADAPEVDDDTAEIASSLRDSDPPMPPPYTTNATVTCNPIKAGSNTLVVNGGSRQFLVQLPANTSNMALLFSWHGFRQESEPFANEVVYDPPAGKWKPFDPNAFKMPLMIVAPVDINLLPTSGLDWDIVSGAKDFPYFEAMLTCIDRQFKIDRRRVYSFGFSAGAVFTNLLAAKYPKLFAATISESGAWFNDKAEWSDVLIPAMRWNWPALTKADRGAVLMTHGGPNDFATIISLESANKKALPFLYNAGRDVTECTHQSGHTLDPDITQAMYYQFMWDHQLGGARPTTLTAGMPTPEKPLFNTRCMFHPAP